MPPAVCKDGRVREQDARLIEGTGGLRVVQLGRVIVHVARDHHRLVRHRPSGIKRELEVVEFVLQSAIPQFGVENGHVRMLRDGRQAVIADGIDHQGLSGPNCARMSLTNPE
jgi:hypothetical protein